MLGSNPITWCSRKQTVAVRSSTEAEYRSLAQTATELCWVQSLLTELHCSSTSTPVVWCDDISTISLTKNPIFHGWRKHIEIDVHFIKEKVANRSLEIRYINTIDQVADLFTKGLHPHRVRFLISKLSIVNFTPQFERG